MNNGRYHTKSVTIEDFYFDAIRYHITLVNKIQKSQFFQRQEILWQKRGPFPIIWIVRVIPM